MKPRKQIALLVSLLCLIMALAEYADPAQVRPSGRWMFIFGPIWDRFGAGGLVAYWACLAVLFGVAFAVMKFKEKE